MEENSKFFNFEGLLGRRNFIINYFIVSVIIGVFINAPHMIYLFFFNPKSILDLNTSSTNWWILFGQIVYVSLIFPSFVRRIRDINPRLNDNSVYVYSSVIALIMIFSAINIPGLQFMAQWLTFAILLGLMSIRGELNNRPKSEIIRFNWGAFIGTWIWGLFNKTPITILMIPLMFTPASFSFSLICGLKGNEWAYKNRKYKSLEEFHESQKRQTIIWSILSPVITLFVMVALFLSAGLFIQNYAKAHPDFQGNIESALKNYQQMAINSYFSDIKEENGEYHFYMNPKVWVKMSNSSKMSVFNSALRYIETKNGKGMRNNTDVSTLNRIKIYSSFNNELLGEFYLEENTFKSTLENAPTEGFKSFKEIIKTVQQGYRFNNHPSLP